MNHTCPNCECLMEQEIAEVWTGAYEEVLEIQTLNYCPCCQYQETDYQDDDNDENG